MQKKMVKQHINSEEPLGVKFQVLQTITEH